MAGISKKKWTTEKGVKKSCWEITWTDANGKPKRKAGYKTRLEAQNDLSNVTKQFDSNMTFDTLVKDYIDRHCTMYCKDSTKDLYESYRKVNLKTLGNRRVKDITKRDLDSVILDWIGDKLAAKTINNMIVFMQACFKHGISEKFFSSDPSAEIKKLPKEKKEMYFLNKNEIPLFLEKAKEMSPDYYALFYTAIFSGMRRGELLALEWNDIDFVDKKVNINKQLYKRKVTPPKTYDSSRIIDIPDSCVEVLKQHKKDSKVLCKIVFCNDEGNYHHPYNMVERYFKPPLREVAKELDAHNITNNLRKIRFHDTRHTYASLLISENIPIKYIQKQLGHADCRITLNTYSHLMPDVNERAINVLDDINKNEQKMSMENMKA